MHSFVHRYLAAAAAAPLLVVVAGCNIEKTTMPALTAPSEFAMSVSVTATPDTITQDGSSEAEISAVVRDADGRPVPGVRLQYSASSSDPLVRQISFTEPIQVTDAGGRATTGLIAPLAPATLPTTPPVVTVMVTPLGDNYQNAVPRTVTVRLLAPSGTPMGNWDPVAVIVADPAVASTEETVHFNGSLTTDEGQACGSRCTYIWDFGDGSDTVRGMIADHRFDSTGTYSVVLTVTDDRGGVGQATKSVRIIEPTDDEN
jgi:hypothetical protein